MWKSLSLSLLSFAMLASAAIAEPGRVVSPAEILAGSTASEWRPIDPENTLYLELPAGRVVIELNPRIAPINVARIKSLVRAGTLDKAVVERAQQNYVVQWGLPDGDRARGDPFRPRAAALKDEFETVVSAPFDVLPDPDAFAPQTGISEGFPAGRDPASGVTWLAHCYGMVGVARGNGPDSADGTEMYAVAGHSPRHLDRNITLVGRVIQGMNLLAAMPFGTGDLGFYLAKSEQTPVRRIQMASDLPPQQRLRLEALRSDSSTWRMLLESRRNRREPWFVRPAGRIDLCNAPLPVRVAAP